MAGRKPKPTAIKELEGNPGKRKLNKKEPKPEKGMLVSDGAERRELKDQTVS